MSFCFCFWSLFYLSFRRLVATLVPCDLQQINVFLRILQYLPPITITAMTTVILMKVALNTITLQPFGVLIFSLSKVQVPEELCILEAKIYNLFFVYVILPLPTISLGDFGTISTVWYFCALYFTFFYYSRRNTS